MATATLDEEIKRKKAADALLASAGAGDTSDDTDPDPDPTDNTSDDSSDESEPVSQRTIYAPATKRSRSYVLVPVTPQAPAQPPLDTKTDEQVVAPTPTPLDTKTDEQVVTLDQGEAQAQLPQVEKAQSVQPPAALDKGEAPAQLDQVERATLVKLPAPDSGERGAPIPQPPKAELVDPDPDELYTEAPDQPEVRRAAAVGITPKAQLVTPPKASVEAPKPRVSEFGLTPDEYKASQEAPAVTGPTGVQPDVTGEDSSGTADYFRKRGDAPITDQDDPRLTVVGVGNQKWNVNKEAAPYFQGFLSELADSGAPMRSDGGWNYRQKVGAKGLSTHSWAGAIDLNQNGRDEVSPEFQKWLQDNPGVLQAAEQRWHIYGGERFGDLGHFEWGGVPGTGVAMAKGAPVGAPGAVVGRATTFGYNDPDDKGVGAPKLGGLSTNNTDLIGAAVPQEALQRYVSAHPADWRKARVEVTTSDGRNILVPIVDLGPRDTSDKRGVVADFTQGLTNLTKNTGEENYSFRIIPNAGPDVMKNPQEFADEQAAIRAGIDTGARFRTQTRQVKGPSYVLAPVSPAESAAADTAAGFENQGQKDNLAALADQTPNLGALIKRLDQPVDGVTDAMRKEYQGQVKDEATKYAQDYYGEKDPQKAYALITSDATPATFTGEVLSKIIPNFGKADVSIAKFMDSADEKRVKQFVDALEPNASIEARAQEIQRLKQTPPEMRGPVINAMIGHADPTTAQAIGDPGNVLDSLNRITDQKYQAARTAAIAEKQNWLDKSLRTDPRLVGTPAEFVTQQLAALPKNIVESLLPPGVRETAFYAEIYEDAKDQFRRANPHMTEDELDQKANLSAMAQLIPQEVLMHAIGGKLGAITEGIQNPVKRVAMSALTHTAVGATAAGVQQVASNIVAGESPLKDVPAAIAGGAIQSAPGGVITGLHGKPEVQPAPEATARVPLGQEPVTPPPETGSKGGEVRGAEPETMATGGEAPSDESSGLKMEGRDRYGNVIGEGTATKGRSSARVTVGEMLDAGGDSAALAQEALNNGWSRDDPMPKPGQGPPEAMPTSADELAARAAQIRAGIEAEFAKGFPQEPDANTHAPVTATPTSEVPVDPIARENSQDTALKAKMQSLQELTGYSHVLPAEAQADLGTAMGSIEGTVQPARRAREADTPALPRTELARAVASFRSKYSGSAPIEVVNNANELPPQVRAQLHAQNAHENISAFVHSHPVTGEKIYVLADRQHSLANLTGDLMEEAIGHSGVRSVLAPAQMQTLARAIDNRFSNDRSYLRLLRQGYDKSQAAEEFLAKLAREPDRSPQFLNGAISYVAGGLRKVANAMGLDFQITKPELQHIIARARRRVETPRPERVGVMTTEPGFRAARTATPSAPLSTEEKVRRLENATISKDSGSKQSWHNFITGPLSGFRSLAPKVGMEKEAYRRGESVPIQHWLRYLKGIDGKTQNDAANQVRHVIDPLLKVPGDLHPKLVDDLQALDKKIDGLRAAGKQIPQKLLDEQKRLDGFKKASPFWLFNRKVLYNDLYARSEIQHGVDSAGRPQYQTLPAGLTKNEVIAQLRQLNHDIAQLTPDQQNAITESLRRHYKMVQDIKGDLTRRGFVIPKEFANPFYYPHILLDHAEGYLARARHSTEEDFRGYLIDPVGSEKLIETSYTKAMMQHLTEVMSHNARSDATAEMLKPLDQSQVFKDQINAENRARALKGQTPLPNRVWEDRARQAGYEIYVPDKHIPMRMEAMIDREKLSKQIGKQINEGDLAENLKRMGVTLTADDLRTALAAGAREKWAVTPEQHAALRDVTGKIEAERAEKNGWGHNIAKMTQAPLSWWKGYKLHSPTAAARYHWGNLTSDVEKIFTADPRVFKHLPEAYRLMSQYNEGGRYPSDRFAKAVEHDVITTPTAGEVNYLRQKLPQFEDLMSRKEKNWGKIHAFWEASQRFGDIRESTFRLAKYLADMDRLDKGQSYEKGQIPAAALVRDLRTHKTNEARAAQNAREMFIDYKAISPAGQFLRKNLIPFYSYQEGNARYFVNTFRNMLDMSVPNKAEFAKRGGRALLTIPSKVLLARSTRGFLLRLGVAHGLLYAWNQYVKQRDDIKDTDLSDEDRRHDYILLGKGKDGKVQLMYVPTAGNDFLSWLGGPAFGQLAGDYLGGRITLQQAATDWGKTFLKDDLSKIVNSVRPELKTAFGLTTGRDLFPDATDPKRIKSYDMPSWIISQAFDQPTADLFESFRDPNFYRNKSWIDTAKQVVLQIRQRDPEQWAYYDIQGKVQDFLESKGYGPHGDSAETPGSQIVRNFKRALFNGDLDAAQRFAQILIDKYGYDSNKFAASIRAQDPMASIKKELRPEFVKNLSQSDLDQMKQAYAYYSRVRGDESKVQTEARAIFGSPNRPKVSREALQAAILAARDQARRATAAEALMRQNPALRLAR